MNRDEVKRRVADILNDYDLDIEAAHATEDDLLWEFVELRAMQGDSLANQLLRLNESDRTRWFA